MAYCLIIAEKPSQAEHLAKVLLKESVAHDGFFEGQLPDGKLGRITALNGRVLDHSPPQDYHSRWGRPWRLDALPFEPPDNQWRRTVTKADALGRVSRLLPGAFEVVNACDAGRQGELIFWLPMRHLGWEYKKLKGTRLWVTDPSPQGILEAWRDRRKAHEAFFLKNLSAAYAQWLANFLWGVNMSRYVTLTLPAYGSLGHPVYSVGSVKTPTLALVQDRVRRIDLFVSVPFWVLTCEFYSEKGNYFATVLAPDGQRFRFDDRRFEHYEDLVRLKVLIASENTAWQVFDSEEPGLESPPPPFNTLEMLRVAGRVLSWTTRRTMRAAQHLYERYGAISYPRTSKEKIPPGLRPKCASVFSSLWKHFAEHSYPRLNDLGELPVSDEYFEEIKEDHHAIIPTGVIPPESEDGTITDELILWDLIVRRFLTSMSLPASILHCQRILELEIPAKSLTVRAVLKADPVVVPNWLLVEDALGNSGSQRDNWIKRQMIAFPSTASEARLVQVRDREGCTTPPEHYTEDTLLQAMQDHALGTPATQADVIAELYEDKVMEKRSSSHLFPTGIGSFLLDMLEQGGAAEVKSPDINASWEAYFAKLEKGERKLADVDSFCKGVVVQAEQLGRALQKLPRNKVCTLCPDTYRIVEHVDDAEGSRFRFYGKYKDINFPAKYNGRKMAASEWREVIMSGRKGYGPFNFISNKTGATITAKLRLDLKKKKFDYVFPKSGFDAKEVIPEKLEEA